MAQLHSGVMPLWTIMGDKALAPVPFFVAGIMNLTPDSFSDGGKYEELNAAMLHVRQMVCDGAHIIDLGAESTRPGAEDIGAAKEMRRLIPVLEKTLLFRDALVGSEADGGAPPDYPPFAVSIDTFRAETAALALSMGVDIINDVSGGTFEPEMAEVLADYKPGYVLGHSPSRPADMQVNPRYNNVVEDLLQYFDERMSALVKAGLPESRICLDPCIGFGKTVEHSLAIMASTERFASLGRPLYYGISRKSFLGCVTGYPKEDRDMHTQVAISFLARQGVHIHRVHDVRAAVATLRLVSKLYSGQAAELPHCQSCA